MSKLPWLRLSDIKTDRWTKAGNGRLLPLNSAAWHKLRTSVLDGEPLCRHCTARGLTVPGTDVDHINNDPSNNDPLNLQVLCHSCHSIKTQDDMHGRDGARGFDLQGLPLSPRHHWNMPATPLLASLEGGVLKRSLETDEHRPYVLTQFNANCETVV